MSRTKYTKVAIPIDLFEKIRDILSRTNLGYRSVNEFIIDATRRRVEEIERMLIEGRG